jgi:hypothetical protein
MIGASKNEMACQERHYPSAENCTRDVKPVTLLRQRPLNTYSPRPYHRRRSELHPGFRGAPSHRSASATVPGYKLPPIEPTLMDALFFTNQLGRGGFTTEDVNHCPLTARTVARVDNGGFLTFRPLNPTWRLDAIGMCSLNN